MNVTVYYEYKICTHHQNWDAGGRVVDYDVTRSVIRYLFFMVKIV
jgi:hypothetical protein